jgi:TonB family protein
LASFACEAKELSIPEVGIELAEVPDKASAAIMGTDTDGYEAVFRIGEAIFVVYRSNLTVPPGTVATDSSWRSSFTVEPNLIDWPQPTGQPTLVSGQPAWASWRAYKTRGDTRFDLTVCVIADAHPYLIQVTAHSRTGKKPADFDTAVQSLESVRFIPLPELRFPTKLKNPPDFPRFTLPQNRDYYPPPAQRLGETGDADITFRIDGSGRAQEVQQTYAVTPDLGMAAENLVRTLSFQVPPNWVQFGADRQHFNVEVQFSLNCHHSCTYPPRISDAAVFGVSAQFK